MDSAPGNIMDLVVGGSIFLLVLSLWVGGVLIWTMRRSVRENRMQDRLGAERPEDAKPDRVLRLWHEGEELQTMAPGAKGRSLRQWLHYKCMRAGWQHGVTAAVMLIIILTITSGGAVGLFSGNWLLAAGVSMATLVVVKLYTSARVSSRDRRFETQLTDAMDLAARSLRAGHPLPGAFQLIAEEAAPPIKTVFAELCQRHGMGASLEDSLREIAEATPSEDMKLFATSVSIQMRAGGNLADLFDRLAKVIRERMRLNRRLRVLTSQTNMSKRVLVALPFLVFIAFNLINPDYMSVFYETTTGQILLAIGACGLAFGTLVMNKMAVLRY